MFDPTIGKWTTLDPIGFDAGDPNLYRYVGNSPTDRTDPSGLADDLTIQSNGGTLIVYDRRGTPFGRLEEVGGVAYVVRNGRMIEFEVVNEKQKPGITSVIGWGGGSPATEYDKWNRYFANSPNAREFTPGGFVNKTVIQPSGPEDEYLNKRSARGETCANQYGETIHGQSYAVAGNAAAEDVKEMLRQVGEGLVEHFVAGPLAGKAVEFLGYMVKRGYKVLRNSSGGIITTIDGSGARVSADQYKELIESFRKTQPSAVQQVVRKEPGVTPQLKAQPPSTTTQHKMAADPKPPDPPGATGGGNCPPSGSSQGVGGVPIAPKPLPQTLKEVNLKGRIQTSGMTPDEAGTFFGWDPSKVTKGVGEFTKDKLIAKGWTKERIIDVAEGYEHVVRITPANPSAAGRAAQLRDLAKLFD